MSNNYIDLLGTKRTALKVDGVPRKSYVKPQLEILGDLRNLTLGGSIGTFDTGVCYPTCPTKPPKGKHSLLSNPTSLSFPGSNPSGATPTPDNPFLP